MQFKCSTAYSLPRDPYFLKCKVLCRFSTVLLQIAYEIKEELRQVYERTRTISGETRKIRSWLRIAEIFYGEICNTIRQHLKGICNYFIHRTTNAVMEGLNNRSRVILISVTYHSGCNRS